ncbi:hypothetical protein pdam_00021320 [Pocillopora damicornis]|uniref:Coiled-coil domain-containing protein 103 n=1 Tax=Pocillopora damicornis TaxID=46731 RepID=A0A3M6V378_POCDA|nr:coiled-coil domain-containing protein 103-like [Pocillopora damicornis]RMX60372.1 hypothetical protein pdam_00021320 [Pocillopora damicornis]
MNDDEGIDFRKLEKELALAVEADEKYLRENDAKFRAVNQRVGSYEEFRDIVSAAHLKPLERKDITGENTRKQPWNPHAQGKSQTVIATPTAQSATLSTSSKNPKTAHEFTKIWKRYCKTEEEKYQLLLKLGGNELRTIFKGEISMGLLGEFLLILNNCLNEKDSSDIFNILTGLSKTNRFDLSLKFLGKEEKNAASSLIKRLEDVISSRETLDKEGEEERRKDSRILLELSEIYGITMAS